MTKLFTGLAWAATAVAVAAAVSGWVLVNYWTWFVLPVWPAIDAISYGEAVGLFFFLSVVKLSMSDVDLDESTEEYRAKTVVYPFALLILLAVGWVAQSIIY